MRRGAPPTRRSGGFFALFRAKRGYHAAALSRWKSNATWLTANATWRPQLTPKPQPYKLPLRCG